MVAILTFLFGNMSIPAIRRFATFLRLICWPFFAGRRRLIMANLRIAFPEKPEAELRQILKKNVQYMFEFALEVLHGMKHPEFFAQQLKPTEFPAELGDRTNGEIWCSAHMGCWEAICNFRNAIGKSGAIVTTEFNYKALDRAMKRMRSYRGTEIIVDTGAAIGCERTLKQGRAFGILIDQNISPRHGGEFVDFFGLPAPTSKMPATLARKYNVPVVMCICIRDDDGTMHREMKLISLTPANDYADDISLINDIFRYYEEIIRKYPEQYLWMYRKWRYIPGNLPAETKAKFPYYAKNTPHYNV